MLKSVLVVEDSEINRHLLHDLLEKVFYCEVVTANDGQEAVDRVKEIKPDLVLMDVGLPVMDGVTATRILKNDRETWAIPVVALTGFSSDEDEERLLASGFDGFLPKPFDLAKLIEKMKDFLSVRQRD
ncbi:MAG: response regulator [Deltaproteobacteria bacterium]|nr:response regulator [Deltaproteobacteria bacterium]